MDASSLCGTVSAGQQNVLLEKQYAIALWTGVSKIGHEIIFWRYFRRDEVLTRHGGVLVRV